MMDRRTGLVQFHTVRPRTCPLQPEQKIICVITMKTARIEGCIAPKGTEGAAPMSEQTSEQVALRTILQAHYLTFIGGSI